MSQYVEWAKLVISEYVKNKKILNLEKYKKLEEFKIKAGVFVSIHLKDKSLRGCIGTIYPTKEDLYTEIQYNAINAAINDPRFLPIEVYELDNINISIDILCNIKKIENIFELNPKKYGIVVEKNGCCGLLLPDLEGVDTVESQLDIAKKKAGIENCSNDDIEISYFSVKRYH